MYTHFNFLKNCNDQEIENKFTFDGDKTFILVQCNTSFESNIFIIVNKYSSDPTMFKYNVPILLNYFSPQCRNSYLKPFKFLFIFAYLEFSIFHTLNQAF